jgi:hypothetical protein
MDRPDLPTRLDTVVVIRNLGPEEARWPPPARYREEPMVVGLFVTDASRATYGERPR